MWVYIYLVIAVINDNNLCGGIYMAFAAIVFNLYINKYLIWFII